MADTPKWTPFLRQILVVLGTSINLSQISIATAYTAILLLQLRRPESEIVASYDMQSWIAAITAITIIVGNFIGSSAMGKFGRKRSSVAAMSLTLIGWIWIALSTSATSLLLGRALQGIPLGMVLVLAPVIIAEYSSPRNRAVFVATMFVTTSLLVLAVHTIGAYITWKTTALIAAITVALALIILIYTPESPSWLANQERYDECAKVYRWLRGKEEEEELQKMIEASKSMRNTIQSPALEAKNTALTLGKIKSVVTRREFYIPISITFHLNTLAIWSGLIMLMSYPMDAFSNLVGSDFDFGLQISLLGVSRLISNIIGIYFIKKMRRRLLLSVIVGLNTCILFMIAVYSYAKVNNMLLFDHPLIGIMLCHMLIMSIVSGASSLTFVITGELFPLEFRSCAVGLTSAVFSINMFITMKIFPSLLNNIGFPATIFLHGFIVAYCLIAALAVLPETKDRTLQDIEDEWRGIKRDCDESELAVPLTSSNRS